MIIKTVLFIFFLFCKGKVRSHLALFKEGLGIRKLQDRNLLNLAEKSY